MDIEALAIADVKLFTPKRYRDERGFFSETFKRSMLIAAGVDVDFVQDNHAFSAPKGVLRGLHFQAPPSAQGKLVRVLRGAIFDVAVDLRRGSPSFGKNVSAIISAENWRQIWVPPGFAHGLLTLEPDTEVLYKVSGGEYDSAREGGLAWNDPDLAIAWPFAPELVNARDRAWPRLSAFETPF